jgi:hypothetical protein
MTRRLAALAVICLVLAPQPSSAWEPATTHAGLTERAATGSRLHEVLEKQFGLENGLFATLTIPPADAAELFKVLRRLNPTHGYVPDARGRLRALGWLAAGSVIADFPARHAANHFYFPRTRTGLTARTINTTRLKFQYSVWPRLAGVKAPHRGVSAPMWLEHPDNPMNLRGFETQYAKAVRARTPGERSRHLAAALLAAGASLHVLQDMGSPSHVRNDLAAHLQRVGNGRLDRGSRFERITALAYGRLGIPKATNPHRATDLGSYFTAADKSGLADRTHYRFFSRFTLPRAIPLRTKSQRRHLADKLARSLRLPYPAPKPSLNLISAKRHSVALRDANQVCLAEYRLDRGVLTWSMSDRCMLEQARALLPEVANYSAGMLDFLFRGELRLLTARGFVVVGSRHGIKSGTVEYYWDDERGVRTKMGSIQVKKAVEAGKVLAAAKPPPKRAKRVVVLFQGVDKDGNRLVATGSSPWPIPKRRTPRMRTR